MPNNKTTTTAATTTTTTTTLKNNGGNDTTAYESYHNTNLNFCICKLLVKSSIYWFNIACCKSTLRVQVKKSKNFINFISYVFANQFTKS